TRTGFRSFPFWVAPIQARIITRDDDSLENAKKLEKELNSLDFRVDLDDRKINYNVKKKAGDLKWIPYVITINKKDKDFQNLIVENEAKEITGKIMRKNDLIKEMKAEDGRDIIVPCYIPILLSKRLISNP
ncbi:MAG TPA: hypothetical protein ENG89_01380, partial [Candidatus Moranbacteria bacterium]|nr:hypothetical protein [Candidatus Moranbacteria bacterium]